MNEPLKQDGMSVGYFITDLYCYNLVSRRIPKLYI